MSPARQSQRLEMVQLTGTGARIMIWAYFVTMATLAIWTLDGVRQSVADARRARDLRVSSASR